MRVNRLLAEGADPNVVRQDWQGVPWTPLTLAVERSSEPIVRLLLDARARADIPESNLPLKRAYDKPHDIMVTPALARPTSPPHPSSTHRHFPTQNRGAGDAGECPLEPRARRDAPRARLPRASQGVAGGRASAPDVRARRAVLNVRVLS